MSGIAAVFNLDGGPADRALVDKMLAAAPYRGIDGMASWSDGPVALGHAMLHTTPESLSEKQPLVDASGEVALSFAGRVDNRDELITALSMRRDADRAPADSEIVRAAYERWGVDFAAQILGDFALVLWDRRERRLLVARDVMGICALYYFTDGRVFICSSELHQLFAHPRVGAEINEPMVAEALSGLIRDAGETLYRGIYRLPASKMIFVSAEGVTVRRYYDLEPARTIKYQSDAEYAEHFGALFNEAVRCRLRCHGGVLADLSGGLDSSSVVGVARQLIQSGKAAVSSFDAMSIDFDRAEANERSYVNDFERQYNLHSRHLPFRARTREAQGDDVRHYRDLPDPPNSMIRDVDDLPGKIGDVRVSLSGNGGDDFLSGSLYAYADLIRGFHLTGLVRLLRVNYESAKRDPLGSSVLRSVFQGGILPLVPPRLRRALKPYLKRPPQLPAAIASEFARRTNLAQRVAPAERLPRCRDFAQSDVYRSYANGWLAWPLEMVDRQMARGKMEGRHPFYDRRLLEFCFAIPENQRVRGDTTKFVMRGAMQTMLPPSILARRDKATFDLTFVETLRAMGGERAFDSLAISRAGWIDGERAKASWRLMDAMYNAGDQRYALYAWQLWMVCAVEIWFSEVFDRGAHSDAAAQGDSAQKRLVAKQAS
jgi:asparagine synthase (glutamine-hydrolysing)